MFAIHDNTLATNKRKWNDKEKKSLKLPHGIHGRRIVFPSQFESIPSSIDIRICAKVRVLSQPTLLE